MFEPIFVSAAHQIVLLIEKQLSRRSDGSLAISTRSNTGGVNRGASSSGPGQCASGSGPGQRAPPNVSLASKASTSKVKCFGCGETGHRQEDCKKQGKKDLFVYQEEYEEEDAYWARNRCLMMLVRLMRWFWKVLRVRPL